MGKGGFWKGPTGVSFRYGEYHWGNVVLKRVLKFVPLIVFVLLQVILVEIRLNEHEMDYKMGIRILVNTF